MTRTPDDVPNGPTDELLAPDGDPRDQAYVDGVKQGQRHLPPATIETGDGEDA